MGIRGAAAIAFAALLLGCAHPVPPARTAYVGEWRSAHMLLVITRDGYVHYVRRGDHGRTSINAPIQGFDGNNFSVGVAFLSTTFVVSQPPHLDGAAWKMTVDGVELVRGAGPADTYT